MRRQPVYAGLSVNRKYAICGSCGGVLCRRDQIAVQPARHDLFWESDWHLVMGQGYIERTEAGMRRLARGNSPMHRKWQGETRSGYRQFPERWPARCPWSECRTLNIIDSKRLDIVRHPAADPSTLAPW